MPARRTPLKHGTSAGYVRGCRKECCTEAQRDYMRAYREANRDRINANSRDSARRSRAKDPQPRPRPQPPETPEARRERLVASELATIQARRPPLPWER